MWRPIADVLTGTDSGSATSETGTFCCSGLVPTANTWAVGGGAEGAGYHQISSLETLHKGTTHAHYHDRDTVGK